MRSTSFLIAALAALLFVQCKKDAAVLQFRYVETYCADPWHALQADNPQGTPQQWLETYLTDSLEVTYTDLTFTAENAPEACLACQCKTGKIIRLKAEESFKNELLDAGFTVE